MNVLQVVPELNVGGVETGTVDLAKYLVGRGHGSIVISSGGALVAELQKAGIPHYTLPVHKKNLWTMVRCITKVRKIIIQENIQIVHARSRVPAWIAYFACRHTQAAFLTTCHGYYRRHWFSHVMGWAKLVIVPSTVIGQHMVEAFGVPKENLRLIARSVDLKKFGVPRADVPGKSHSVISIVGRITPLKGHTYFLRAMATVIRSLPYVKIWVIGGVPEKKASYKQELEVLVRQLGLSEQVEFLGNRQDVPQLLAQTDVLVLSTTTQEAFGRVILEAQAAGVPVVATRVGGVIEIIDDDRTGILVPPKDPDAMAQEVVRLLRDRKLAETIVKAARKKLEERFTLDMMAHKTIGVYEELLRSQNILVIKISAVGDVVLVTASLKALREKFPNASIYCLVGKESREVLARCPYLDGLIVFDPKEKDRGLAGIWRMAQKLRLHKFDKVIDFQNNRTSHLLSFLSFPPQSYGYAGKFGWLLTHRLKNRHPPMGPVEHQFQILKMLGIHFNHPALELWPSRNDEHYIQDLWEAEWIGQQDQVIGINISASGRWPTKNWPLLHLAKLCDLLTAKNYRVVITGTQKDKASARKLAKMTKAKPTIVVGRTDLLQLAALIKRCKVYITPDSAPMHVAAAMGTPFIALFGPTQALRHLPPAKHFSVLKMDLPCAPCYSSTCRVKTHDCMQQISPEQVFKAVVQLAEKRR